MRKKIIYYLYFILIIQSIRTFIIDIYYVSSSSMYPTLERGDFVIAVKNYKLNKTNCDYGDIIIFQNPLQPDELLIKRIVGLLEDTIQIDKGYLFVNGNKEDEILELRHHYNFFYQDSSIKTANYTNYEMLKLKKQNTDHRIIRDPETFSIDIGIFPPEKVALWNKSNYGPIIVSKNYSFQNNDGSSQNINIKHESDTNEPNYFFVMGDNRYESIDSRFFGCIAQEYIKAKVVAKF